MSSSKPKRETGLTIIPVQSEVWRRKEENGGNETNRASNVIPMTKGKLGTFEVRKTSPNDMGNSFNKSISSPPGRFYGIVMRSEFFSSTTSDDMGRTQFYHIADESTGLMYPV